MPSLIVIAIVMSAFFLKSVFTTLQQWVAPPADNVNDQVSVETITPTVTPTAVITTTLAPDVVKSVTAGTQQVGANVPKIDCIGPDGKHLQVTQKECDDFNNAWKNPSDKMVICGPFKDGSKITVKQSECQQMVSCQVGSVWIPFQKDKCKEEQAAYAEKLTSLVKDALRNTQASYRYNYQAPTSKDFSVPHNSKISSDIGISSFVSDGTSKQQQIDTIGGRTSYTKLGDTWFGSDGDTYTRLGNNVFGSNGVTYTQLGDTVFGSDASNYQRLGDTVFSNDGTTYTNLGGTTFGSDGSTATRIGDTLFVSD